MKMWKQWMALLMIFCLLMPGALAGSIDLTDDLDEEVGSVTESSAGEDYTISDNGDIILDDDDDLGGDVIFDDDGSTIEITDNEIDDTIDPDKLDINANLPSNVVNILLVGVDTRSTSLDDGLQNGDVQIIVSINKDDGSIKLTSILRDLYVTIPGYKNKNRINTAYSRGGGQLAMRTINKNFELNIENYITINFYGLASIIDSLGGIDIEMTAKEAKAINTYLRQHPPKYDNQSKDYTRENLPNKAGTHHCDGHSGGHVRPFAQGGQRLWPHGAPAQADGAAAGKGAGRGHEHDGTQQPAERLYALCADKHEGKHAL